MLSIEQFAEKMAVGRTTVHDWIKSGCLLPGRHYIKLGGTARFPWGPELFQRLLEDSMEPEKHPNAQDTQVLAEVLQPATSTVKRKLQMNMDY